MKHVVMGTAGHIDHGKTTLIKKLTGIDTDRLIEEKRRGMTIELGFASLLLPSGNIVSIVDVPGHEKFVKTMVAGATGIDFALLVVAADEGIMPQTREHIDILSILKVRSGVVALTKIDLVDEARISVVKEEIKGALIGTTLEGISVIPVSANSGAGIEKLIEKIDELTIETSNKNYQQLFRLPVDRVFTIAGHGTVVTGTVAGGSISKGELVDIIPEGLTAKVRNVQVHNASVEKAAAGDRCALNLSGIEKNDIKRGSVVAQQGIIKPVKLVDVVIDTVKGIEGISHNQRVHVHIGTKEVLARIRILGREFIGEADHGYAQLRFEEPVAALRGDRFIIRDYSPVATLGGGIVLFHRTENKKRFDAKAIEGLKLADIGDEKQIIEFIIANSNRLVDIDYIYQEILEDKNSISKVLLRLTEEGKIGYMAEADKYFDKDFYLNSLLGINVELEKIYKKYPYRYQIAREEVKSRIFNDMTSKDFSAFVNTMVEDKKFKINDNYLSKGSYKRIDEILGSKELKKIESIFLSQNLGILSLSQILEETKISINEGEEIVKFLLSISRLKDIGDGQFINDKALEKAKNKVVQMIGQNGQVTVAEFRDGLQIGRKTAVLLLEYFDSIQLTQREENIRKPGAAYTKLNLEQNV